MKKIYLLCILVLFVIACQPNNTSTIPVPPTNSKEAAQVSEPKPAPESPSQSVLPEPNDDIVKEIEESIKTGTLIARTIPKEADLYIDGVFMGKTPVTLKVEEGKHDIRISKNGYKNHYSTVTITQSQETTVYKQLEK